MVSSYLTLLVVAESTPKVNEDGEEEYSLPGYILRGSANVIKWGIKLAVGQKKVEVVESAEGESDYSDDEDDENELII